MRKITTLLLSVMWLISCNSTDDTPANTDANFTVPETDDIIMYEINIGSFSDQGNLRGITARLDQIDALGINTIWLMPIHPIGSVNSFGSPYCVQDYRAVNPQLGSVEDLKELVREAHRRDIAVILDWVANHTAWDNPWVAAHPEWYTQDANGNIVSPEGTNWSDVADLNFANDDMRTEMLSAMEYWIQDVGVDGFRCDAADMIPFDFWQQSINALETRSDRKLIMLAEGTRADHFAAGFQLNFAWDWYNSVKSVIAGNALPEILYAANTSEYDALPSGKRKLRFTTNHDLSNELTPLNVFGSKPAALAASVATIFMNGTPLLYSGQEVGVSDPATYTSGLTINWSANPDMLSAYTALLQFYKSSEAAKNGNLVVYSDAEFVVFEKIVGNDKILVIINSDSSGKFWSVPNNLAGSWRNALSNQQLVLTQNLELNGFEYLILKNN